MLEILLSLYEFFRDLWRLLKTLWFAIHGIIRFVFRMCAAVPTLLASLPVWLLPLCLMCLVIGLGLFAFNRG